MNDRLPIVSGAEIDRHHAVNVRASALMIAEFAKRSLARNARGGRIVVVSIDAAHGRARTTLTP